MFFFSQNLSGIILEARMKCRLGDYYYKNTPRHYLPDNTTQNDLTIVKKVRPAITSLILILISISSVSDATSSVILDAITINNVACILMRLRRRKWNVDKNCANQSSKIGFPRFLHLCWDGLRLHFIRMTVVRFIRTLRPRGGRHQAS